MRHTGVGQRCEWSERGVGSREFFLEEGDLAHGGRCPRHPETGAPRHRRASCVMSPPQSMRRLPHVPIGSG